MIKIAVCDDDEKTLRDTLRLLEQYKKLPLSADAYTSGQALLDAGKKYDILLLDIVRTVPSKILCFEYLGRQVVMYTAQGQWHRDTDSPVPSEEREVEECC